MEKNQNELEKKVKNFCIVMAVIVILATLGSCSGKKYEDNLNNGFNKMKNGQYDEMTKDERKAVDDSYEWFQQQDKDTFGD